MRTSFQYNTGIIKASPWLLLRHRCATGLTREPQAAYAQRDSFHGPRGILSGLACARHHPRLGARHASKLLQAFGSPEAIFRAPLTELEAQGIPAAVAQVTFWPVHECRSKELAAVQKAGVRLMTWEEPLYPARLRKIYDAPPLLYVRGNAELLDRYSIGIVGTRRPSSYGNQMTERLGRDLAQRGLVVASGLGRVELTLAPMKARSAFPLDRLLGFWVVGLTWFIPRRIASFSYAWKSAAKSSVNFPWARFRRRRISRCVTG